MMCQRKYFYKERFLEQGNYKKIVTEVDIINLWQVTSDNLCALDSILLFKLTLIVSCELCSQLGWMKTVIQIV